MSSTSDDDDDDDNDDNDNDNDYYLEYPVQRDHGARPAHPRAAVHHDGPLLRTHAIPERPDKSEKRNLSESIKLTFAVFIH